MTDKPILFSGPMVRALLEGRKTQTRRVITSNIPKGAKSAFATKALVDPTWWWTNGAGLTLTPPIGRLPNIGDRLYVREAWSTRDGLDKTPPRDISPNQAIAYRADDDGPWLGKFRQGMHMPRWASRMTLMVTDVRVQRLQEINEQDAIAEGCKGYVSNDGEDGESPREEFEALWNSLNGSPKPVHRIEASGKKVIDHFISYPWAGEPRTEIFRGLDHLIRPNPWVSAYSFDVVKQNIDQIGMAA